VRADTSRGGRLPVLSTTAASVWLERTTPASARISPAAPLGELPPPVPAPDSVPAAAPATESDPALHPPILRSPGTLETPRGASATSVVLDVLVSENGTVVEARAADLGADPTAIAAARRCALGMRFYPALRDGRPVAVWCRQRFEFGAGPVSPPGRP